MRTFFPVLCCALFVLTACGESESDYVAQSEELCIEAVSDKMKDPTSTEFRDVVVEYAGETEMSFQNADGTTDEDVPGEYWVVTGEVNAKNGFGAMVGFRGFECEAKKHEGRDMSTGYVSVERR